MKNSEMKSKVVTLANRLTSRMGNKSAAFIRAWGIVKNGGLEITVKGVSFGNRQYALQRLAQYKPEQIRAVFVPEPSNPKDMAAIAVMVGVQNGKGLFRLGYVPKELTAVVSSMPGNIHSLRVVSGTWGYANRVTLGARIALAV